MEHFKDLHLIENSRLKKYMNKENFSFICHRWRYGNKSLKTKNKYRNKHIQKFVKSTDSYWLIRSSVERASGAVSGGAASNMAESKEFLLVFGLCINTLNTY